ncbi:GNAT family N-acetyltransferase [Paenisporosarcina cavernae]|uniref:GNAT family N-acetyltransferase n=1 Tax=Paenisporosarcina cavernae TaxID=2320858 RepID=A0A385YPH9_9BACL|nr:GNAT family N-acetyltransferase [Paenisporosarcina cavernae]AYC28506.1 GNAT family N-acetyltransferase [Paenisporosarcina cavernae]
MKTFVKDYKKNDQLRQSFADLAKKTFGIDFETWYQNRYWNEHYICYSYALNGDIIANVSINTMNVFVHGNVKKAIQIGTVMTNPAYRNQGLASELLEKVFADYDSTCDFYFLAANDRAISLYEKNGFTSWIETSFVIDVTNYSKRNRALEPVEMTGKEFLKRKRKSIPISNKLAVENDEHVWMFYYLHGFNACLYTTDHNLTIVAEFDQETCHLYGTLSERPFHLEQHLPVILHEGINEVICHFTVDEPLPGLFLAEDTSNNWMVRSVTGASFPKNTRFPKLAQA